MNTIQLNEAKIRTENFEFMINFWKERLANEEKFFEVAKPLKIYKTEYSFGLNDENVKCDIHDVEIIGTEKKLFRGKVKEIFLPPWDFVELLKGKIKETT